MSLNMYATGVTNRVPWGLEGGRKSMHDGLTLRCEICVGVL